MAAGHFTYAKVIDLHIVGRMASGVVQARLRYEPEDAPGDEMALVLLLPPELARVAAEDLTTLQRLPPVKALDA